ncbi:MAG: Rrf2 family transcriptional regulator [Desulfobacterales bacterium SG8_35]|nr:MAG: Rrf2 family transcriptional regulator [Desulfobacterales bacterium SG8_35]
MRLTRAGEYAVRCVMCLARNGSTEKVVSRQVVAGCGDIPSHFLAKIAQQLSRAGIIEILQGARGGYRLIVPPEKLTLLEVIEAIIGEIFLNDCVIRPESCHASASCAVNNVWMQARNQLRQTLAQVTFARLLEEESCCILQSGIPQVQDARNAKTL